MNVGQAVNLIPTISVLLPVYNAERYLRAAIDSVLAQTFEDFELLALDDGSTDLSFSILREYAAKDRRLLVCSRENRGLVETPNELIAIARGRYLARMDADDICLPHRFEKQVKFLDAHPDYVLVGGWVERTNAAGHPIGVYPSPCFHEEIDRDHIKGIVSICHPSAMFRKTAAINVGGYRSEFAFGEDLDLFLRLAEVGKIANLPENLLQYRMHPKSISEAHGILQRDAMRRVCKDAWRRRGIEGRFEPDDHWRPTTDTYSRHKWALEFGWVAWSNGHKNTWWSYAREALRLRPFAFSSWQLLVFGLFKTSRKNIQ